MSKFAALLKSAYESEYDFQMRKQYSEPKICDFDGNLKERWYVYFSFRNPENGKLERQKAIYGDLHHHKNVRDRKQAANNLRHAASIVLKGGYNPFTDENAFDELDQDAVLTVAEAIKFVLDLKKKKNNDGQDSFGYRVNEFKKWLFEKGFEHRHITSVTKKVVMRFFNDLIIKTSEANRNVSRANLSSFFQVLVDNEMITTNPVAAIKKIKTKPQRNKIYTHKQKTEIFELLQVENPALLLYIKFVMYGFVREVEVNRLKIGDIDFVNKVLHYKSKTKPLKIKILPDILSREIPDLSTMPRDAYLFGYTGLCQFWDAGEVRRREHYGNLFLEIVKKPLGLGPDYSIYGFRHTGIVELYDSFKNKGLTDYEVKVKLMPITGHRSIQALEAYLRDIDADLPEDYSHHFKK